MARNNSNTYNQQSDFNFTNQISDRKNTSYYQIGQNQMNNSYNTGYQYQIQTQTSSYQVPLKSQISNTVKKQINQKMPSTGKNV